MIKACFYGISPTLWMLVPGAQASDLTPDVKLMNLLFPKSQFVLETMRPRVTLGRQHHIQYL